MRRASLAHGLLHEGGLGATRKIAFRSSGEFLTVTKKDQTPPERVLADAPNRSEAAA